MPFVVLFTLSYIDLLLAIGPKRLVDDTNNEFHTFHKNSISTYLGLTHSQCAYVTTHAVASASLVPYIVFTVCQSDIFKFDFVIFLFQVPETYVINSSASTKDVTSVSQLIFVDAVRACQFALV